MGPRPPATHIFASFSCKAMLKKSQNFIKWQSSKIATSQPSPMESSGPSDLNFCLKNGAIDATSVDLVLNKLYLADLKNLAEIGAKAAGNQSLAQRRLTAQVLSRMSLAMDTITTESLPSVCESLAAMGTQFSTPESPERSTVQVANKLLLQVQNSTILSETNAEGIMQVLNLHHTLNIPMCNKIRKLLHNRVVDLTKGNLPPSQLVDLLAAYRTVTKHPDELVLLLEDEIGQHPDIPLDVLVNCINNPRPFMSIISSGCNNLKPSTIVTLLESFANWRIQPMGVIEKLLKDLKLESEHIVARAIYALYKLNIRDDRLLAAAANQKYKLTKSAVDVFTNAAVALCFFDHFKIAKEMLEQLQRFKGHVHSDTIVLEALIKGLSPQQQYITLVSRTRSKDENEIAKYVALAGIQVYTNVQIGPWQLDVLVPPSDEFEPRGPKFTKRDPKNDYYLALALKPIGIVSLVEQTFKDVANRTGEFQLVLRFLYSQGFRTHIFDSTQLEQLYNFETTPEKANYIKQILVNPSTSDGVF